jgi:hypothetical protein
MPRGGALWRRRQRSGPLALFAAFAALSPAVRCVQCLLDLACRAPRADGCSTAPHAAKHEATPFPAPSSFAPPCLTHRPARAAHQAQANAGGKPACRRRDALSKRAGAPTCVLARAALTRLCPLTAARATAPPPCRCLRAARRPVLSPETAPVRTSHSAAHQARVPSAPATHLFAPRALLHATRTPRAPARLRRCSALSPDAYMPGCCADALCALSSGCAPRNRRACASCCASLARSSATRCGTPSSCSPSPPPRR